MTNLLLQLSYLHKIWVKLAYVGVVVCANTSLLSDGIAQSVEHTSTPAQPALINTIQAPLVTEDDRARGETESLGIVTPNFSEAFGKLEKGSSAADVVAFLGPPKSKGKKQFWGGGPTFRYAQYWEYPQQGIALLMVSDTQDSPQRVYDISIKSPSQLQTKLGLKIGDSKQTFLELYGDGRMCGPRITELSSHGICEEGARDEVYNGQSPIYVSEDHHVGGLIKYYGGFFIWIDQGRVKEMIIAGGVG